MPTPAGRKATQSAARPDTPMMTEITYSVPNVSASGKQLPGLKSVTATGYVQSELPDKVRISDGKTVTTIKTSQITKRAKVPVPGSRQNAMADAHRDRPHKTPGTKLGSGGATSGLRIRRDRRGRFA